MAGKDGDGRRYPKSLDGVLKYTIENTKAEDGQASEFRPMTEERKAWLQEVLSTMAGADPVKIMLEDIQVLVNPGDPDDADHVTRREEALEDLQLHCEDLDLANDFHKIGGYSVLRTLLSNPNGGIRWRAADLVATLTQNNPYSQKAILDGGFLPLLLETLNLDPVANVKIKALYAISCLVREHHESREAFVQQDGFSALIRAMVSDIEKLQVKSVFLLAHFCEQHPQYKDTLCDVGVVEQLVSLLHAPHQPWHEHVAHALLSLILGHQAAQQESRRPELRLAEVIRERKLLLKGKSEFEEELDYVAQIEKLCFTDQGDGER